MKRKFYAQFKKFVKTSQYVVKKSLWNSFQNKNYLNEMFCAIWYCHV